MDNPFGNTLLLILGALTVVGCMLVVWIQVAKNIVVSSMKTWTEIRAAHREIKEDAKADEYAERISRP